jgi:hypothetical protein
MENTMRQAIERLLPPRRAKRWITALELKHSDPALNRRSLYSVLNWMRLRGVIAQRKNELTRLYEYAAMPKSEQKP